MHTTKTINLLSVFLLICSLGFLIFRQMPTWLPGRKAGADVTAPVRNPLPRLNTALQGKTFFCTGDNVRIRTTPDFTTDTNIVQDVRLMKGDTVILLAKSVDKFTYNGTRGSWHLIRHPGGIQGWVFYYLELQPPLPPPPALPRAQRQADRSSGWRKWVDEAFIAYDKNFGNTDEKALAVLVGACDFANERVRSTAVREAVKNKSDGYFNLGQVCNLYEYAVKGWKYVNDPGAFEYVAKASESLENRQSGDCDDFAVLVFSLITAIGGDCRINYACQGFGGCHAFAEVNIGEGDNLDQIKEYLSIRFRCSREDLIGFRRDANGSWWLNLDWFDTPKHPGGMHFSWSRGVCFNINNRSFDRY